jgi:hypothetical protein
MMADLNVQLLYHEIKNGMAATRMVFDLTTITDVK